ncbi:phosphatidylinositol phosphatase PTPRQ-like [Acanthaster planci]|uniref:Phosphatidylinositol phosphatase PTPRQ-like n=1 Tax=Acanthaster planci TaxID=133434 RepID=A0A8B7ZRZ9_ACAPL|nr:phosphatidylinositol phosphatase PTPRQ-like [Acanthaster planci]
MASEKPAIAMSLMLVFVLPVLPEVNATGQVQNLTVVNVEGTPGAVLVTWVPPESPDSPVEFYRVSYMLRIEAQCNTLNNPSPVVAAELATGTSYTITGLLPYSNYEAIVEASTGTGLQGEARAWVQTPEVAPTDPPRGVRLLKHASGGTYLAFTWDDIECSIGTMSSAFRSYYFELNSVDQPNTAPITGQAIRGPKLIFDLLPFHRYAFKVAIRSQVGDGPFSDPLVVRTEESSPSIPADFHANETSETSVTCTWEEPRNPNGVITNYTITLRPSNRPFDLSFVPPLSATEIRHLGPNVFSSRFTDLEPGSYYELSAAAWTSYGAGTIDIVETFTWPKMDILGPSLPVVDPYASNDTSVTISLEDPDDYYVTSYLVAVESDAPRSKRSPVEIDGRAFGTFSNNPHAYIAAEIPKGENTGSVVVGDGKMYGGYLNVALVKGTLYRIRIGSKSAIDWRSSVFWSPTLKETAGAYDFLPTAPMSSTPSKGHSISQQWMLGAVPWAVFLSMWLC